MLALIFNVNRGKGDSPKGVVDFHPYAPKPKTVKLADLKDVWLSIAKNNQGER